MSKIEAPEWAMAQVKKRGRPSRYPFVKMDLYEVISIAANELHVPTFAEFEAYLKKFNAVGRLGTKKFVCRQIEDGTVEVCRVK